MSRGRRAGRSSLYRCLFYYPRIFINPVVAARSICRGFGLALKKECAAQAPRLGHTRDIAASNARYHCIKREISLHLTRNIGISRPRYSNISSEMQRYFADCDIFACPAQTFAVVCEDRLRLSVEAGRHCPWRRGASCRTSSPRPCLWRCRHLIRQCRVTLFLEIAPPEEGRCGAMGSSRPWQAALAPALPVNASPLGRAHCI